MKQYVTVANDARTEMIVKRSRFIGSCVKIGSEADARAAIANIQKEFWDASHNCFAFVVVDGSVARSSDAGEPSGTAGAPILEVLRAREIQGSLIVVTRYFGGTLLGRGGLVSAYSKSAAMALNKAGTVRFVPAVRVRVEAPYGMLGTLESYIGGRTHALLEKEYAQSVRVGLTIPSQAREEFERGLVDMSGGKLRPEFGEEDYCAF